MSRGLHWDKLPVGMTARPHGAPPMPFADANAQQYDVKLGAQKKPLNKTEVRYQQLLDLRARAGEITAYLPHESVKLRLAAKTWWTPDFPVIGLDGRLEFHEVKGRFGAGRGGGFMDDARIKLKVCAEQYPWFGFRIWIWNKGSGCFVETERFNC